MVAILILLEVALPVNMKMTGTITAVVAILILLEGALPESYDSQFTVSVESRNPYSVGRGFACMSFIGFIGIFHSRNPYSVGRGFA